MNEALNNDEEAHQHQDEWFIFPRKKSKQLQHIETITHLTFDRSTRVISKSAFSEHPLLQSVRIPKNTVKKIGKEAFWKCKSLSRVDFQEGLQTIGNDAFDGCSALEGDVKLPDTLIVLGSGAFSKCIALNRFQLSRGLQILRSKTFYFCRAMVEIDMPENGLLSTIEDKTFYGCESLRNVKIPHTVKVIGESAFEQCRSLTFVNLPKGLKKIRKHTFASCNSLIGIVIPDCLEEIHYGAFRQCYSLLGVEFAKDSHVKIEECAFSRCVSLVNVCIPGTIEFVKFDKSPLARCVQNSCLSSMGPDCILPFSSNKTLRGRDGIPNVYDRFAKLPIHNLCYHSSETRVDQLKQTLDAYSDMESPSEHKDYLGMTPFHIVATSANPRVDILECLLCKYPVEMLEQEDIRGRTMMDYLLQNKTGVLVLQMVLRIVFAEWLLPLKSLKSSPKQAQEVPDDLAMNLNDQIESLAECVGRKSVRERVREIFESVGFHSRSELTGLLELASWKRRIVDDEVQNETSCSSRECKDREICRYQSGAEVVIENVTGYLWANESKCSTALSVFPFCGYGLKERRTMFHSDPHGAHFFDA